MLSRIFPHHDEGFEMVGPVGQVVVGFSTPNATGALKLWQAKFDRRTGDQRTTWKGFPPV
jgi:hypothetical protein